MTLDWMRTANRLSNWQEASVVVAGLGVSGFAAADGLMSLGAKVTVPVAGTASGTTSTSSPSPTALRNRPITRPYS